ncbi:MAG: PF20097 family protein [Oscillospiraceae bacterium]
MTIGDKCPYCGRELLSGYLQSARQIIWSQEEKSISFRADEEGDLVVSHGIWEGSFADCRYCADCGIFLLERPTQPPKFGERLRGTFGRLRGGTHGMRKRPHAALTRRVRVFICAVRH